MVPPTDPQHPNTVEGTEDGWSRVIVGSPVLLVLCTYQCDGLWETNVLTEVNPW